MTDSATHRGLYRSFGYTRISSCISFFFFLLLSFSICFFFFFQAEDGIRDLVRSRGLGDVYKRQALGLSIVLVKDDDVISISADGKDTKLGKVAFGRVKVTKKTYVIK